MESMEARRQHNLRGYTLPLLQADRARPWMGAAREELPPEADHRQPRHHGSLPRRRVRPGGRGSRSAVPPGRPRRRGRARLGSGGRVAGHGALHELLAQPGDEAAQPAPGAGQPQGPVAVVGLVLEDVVEAASLVAPDRERPVRVRGCTAASAAIPPPLRPACVAVRSPMRGLQAHLQVFRSCGPPVAALILNYPASGFLHPAQARPDGAI
mmetsp:Transcript_52574/g.126537  ORF Transcript_52574/g.126537 Transcript_52574/m.126537 type:complete len:211 (+) Transcript_52574:184-816(+)